MKTQENYLWIDKIIAYYQSTPRKTKSWVDKIITYYQTLPHDNKVILNFILATLLVVFTLSAMYQLGEGVGKFLYRITH